MDEALDKAIDVFLERGFHATSVSDLASGMGLAVGSVYKAFTDKRAVFLAALERYIERRNLQVRNVVNASSPGREQLRCVLTLYARSAEGGEGSKGCLLVATATHLAAFDEAIAERVASVFASNVSFIEALIRKGQSDQSIRSDLDTRATASALAFMTQGLRVAGKASLGKPPTKGLVQTAMRLLD